MGTKVAFVSQSGDLTGGAEESLALLLSRLTSEIEPTVILFSDGAFAERLRRAGVPVTIAPLSGDLLGATRERFAHSALRAGGAVYRLHRTLVETRARVVHTNSVKAHILGSLAARSAGLSAVVHLRDILTGTARSVLRSIAGVCSRERIAISKSVAEAYGLPRTSVIYNPLDLNLYRDLPAPAVARRSLGLPEHGTMVGLVGRINRWKGHDTFIEIAARLQRHEHLHFAIVGEARFRDADFVPELHERVRSHGLESRVHFVPWCDDARRVYAALDVNCNTSTREPLGRTILEAAACGVASVSFADGGPAEIVPRTGGIAVPPGDLEGFARAIEAILDGRNRDCDRAIRRASVGAFGVDSHVREVTTVLQRAAR